MRHKIGRALGLAVRGSSLPTTTPSAFDPPWHQHMAHHHSTLILISHEEKLVPLPQNVVVKSKPSQAPPCSKIQKFRKKRSPSSSALFSQSTLSYQNESAATACHLSERREAFKTQAILSRLDLKKLTSSGSLEGKETLILNNFHGWPKKKTLKMPLPAFPVKYK